jgi:hypothetical protein
MEMLREKSDLPMGSLPPAKKRHTFGPTVQLSPQSEHSDLELRPSLSLESEDEPSMHTICSACMPHFPRADTRFWKILAVFAPFPETRRDFGLRAELPPSPESTHNFGLRAKLSLSPESTHDFGLHVELDPFPELLDNLEMLELSASPQRKLILEEPQDKFRAQQPFLPFQDDSPLPNAKDFGALSVAEDGPSQISAHQQSEVKKSPSPPAAHPKSAVSFTLLSLTYILL